MRTITLELLRHGPAHNQLLSPLTPYLALCENHEAVTVQVTLEHSQLLHRLRALSYRLGEEARQFQLHDTARWLAGLLASIPGLGAELQRGQGDGSAANGTTNAPASPLHLRLVLSASELALLPFELALAPSAWPGAGQPVLLQQQAPICITRETRRVPQHTLAWPQETRVLLVLASPAGLPPVPDLAHLVALRGCLAAWAGSPASVAQHLTVITDATLAAVERACAEQTFTHVHILAHGGERSAGFDTRFGLLLHSAGDPQGPADVVSGERLASALRTVRRGAGGGLDGTASSPSVVTLASCNSGAVGGVMGVGASIAHALHQAGIPVVIASQFPLSFGGSVRMVETLYDGLLWGDDPRSLLVALRRQLHTQFPDTSDWASITAYTALPADFEAQLGDAQVQRAMTAINVAIAAVQAAVLPPASAANAASGDGSDSGQAIPPAAASSETIASAVQQMQRAKARLAGLAPTTTTAPLRVLKLLASTEKREAGLHHLQAGRAGQAGDGARQAQHLTAMWAGLGRARRLYFGCWQQQRSAYFTTQYLSLGLALQLGGKPASGDELPGRAPEQLWHLAEVQALHDLHNTNTQEQVWAVGTLIELYLLAPALPGLAARQGDWPAQALALARRLADTLPADAFELLSTRRQVARYLQWYGPLCSAAPAWLPGLLASAQALVDVLPTLEDAAWDYARG